MSNHHVEHALPVEAADSRKLRTYFQDVDKQIVKLLAEKYGQLVPPERLKTMLTQPTSFETPAEFAKNYKAEFGQKPQPGVVGYTERGHSSHVSTEDMAGVPETNLHERLHQMSDARAPEILGQKRYEGITEDLALKLAGQEPAPGDRVAYPEARAAADSLRKNVGDDAVDEAYFKGDPAKLREKLNSILENDSSEPRTKPLDHTDS